MAKVSGCKSGIIRRSLSARRILHWCCALFLVSVGLANFPLVVQAHSSGPPRVADAAAGPYHVFVWTQPEPLRVGDVHISILVTQANQPVNDAQVQVQFAPIEPAGPVIVVAPTAQDFLSNIYYEADVQLPSSGEWRATINIEGVAGKGSIDFENSVLAKRTFNWPVVGGAAALLVVLVGLMGVWSRMQAKATVPANKLTPPRPVRTEINDG